MGRGIKKWETNTKFVILLTAVILLMEAVGGGIIYYAWAKEKICCAEAEGTLINWEKRKDKKSRKYVPVVEYRVGKEIYTGISNIESLKRTIEEGSPVLIGYDPSNPYNYYLKGYDLEAIRSFGGIFMVLGAVFAAVNIICAILNRMEMDDKRKVRIKEWIFILCFFAAFSWFIIALAGIRTALLVVIVMAPFVLYVKLKNRKDSRDDSASRE